MSLGALSPAAALWRTRSGMAGLWPAGWNQPGAASAAPVILTAALPPALQQAADALRRRLQPEASAHAPAHLTLFRHLPGCLADELLSDMRAICAGTPAPLVRLATPQRWESLWACPVKSPDLAAIRAEFAERWHGLLAPGDIAPPLLHISLCKGADAPPPLAETPWRVPGLLLWQYGKACWTPLVACRFHR